MGQNMIMRFPRRLHDVQCLCLMQADNPGVWILHCHLTVHFVIGQALYIVEDKTAISAPPPGMPQCPSTCGYSYGLLNQTTVAARYGNSGFETPDEVVIG